MLGLLKNALATVFLFLFLLTASLWVRSYWVCELWLNSQNTRSDLSFARDSFGFASGRGGVYFNRSHSTWSLSNRKKADDQAMQLKDGWQRTFPTNPGYGGNYFDVSKNGTVAGFGLASSDESNNISTLKSTSILFPYAAPTVVLGMTAWGLVNHCRNVRRKRRFVQSSEFADNDYLRPREAA